MEIQNKTIALLIDSDNISREYFSIILDELSQYGNVTYRRLYGDFTNNKANGWKPVILEYAVEPVQQLAFTKGKNATDSRMIIDAMDILYSGKVDCFCIATNDSDFTSLAMRFRNDNIIVIGACEERTPDSFKKACHRIISVDKLLAASKSAKTKEPQDSEKQLRGDLNSFVKACIEIVNNNSDLNGYMHFSSFMNEVYRKFNDFNPKLYGAENNKVIQFFKELEYTNGHPVFTFKRENKVDLIKNS